MPDSSSTRVHKTYSGLTAGDVERLGLAATPATWIDNRTLELLVKKVLSTIWTSNLTPGPGEKRKAPNPFNDLKVPEGGQLHLYAALEWWWNIVDNLPVSGPVERMDALWKSQSPFTEAAARAVTMELVQNVNMLYGRLGRELHTFQELEIGKKTDMIEPGGMLDQRVFVTSNSQRTDFSGFADTVIVTDGDLTEEAKATTNPFERPNALYTLAYSRMLHAEGTDTISVQEWKKEDNLSEKGLAQIQATAIACSRTLARKSQGYVFSSGKEWVFGIISITKETGDKVDWGEKRLAKVCLVHQEQPIDNPLRRGELKRLFFLYALWTLARPDAILKEMGKWTANEKNPCKTLDGLCIKLGDGLCVSKDKGLVEYSDLEEA